MESAGDDWYTSNLAKSLNTIYNILFRGDWENFSYNGHQYNRATALSLLHSAKARLRKKRPDLASHLHKLGSYLKQPTIDDAFRYLLPLEQAMDALGYSHIYKPYNPLDEAVDGILRDLQDKFSKHRR